jgi:hypothetical protein
MVNNQVFCSGVHNFYDPCTSTHNSISTENSPTA